MKIHKKSTPFETVQTLDEWKNEFPPQGGDLHWKEGRSAMETAKHWLNGIPKEFVNILKCFQFQYDSLYPEHITIFDEYKGNGRNHDLLILATDQQNDKVVISVESKVDEPFDKQIGPYLAKIKLKKAKGEKSNADFRIEKLKLAICPNVKREVFELLQYQLLSAIAGTLVEAKKQGAKKAIFLLQTFISLNMDQKKHQKNQQDLDCFLNAISNGKHCNIQDNELFGPFRFAGNEFIPSDVELWIGKYSIDI
jgi:hypothetical protein